MSRRLNYYLIALSLFNKVNLSIDLVHHQYDMSINRPTQFSVTWKLA